MLTFNKREAAQLSGLVSDAMDRIAPEPSAFTKKAQ